MNVETIYTNILVTRYINGLTLKRNGGFEDFLAKLPARFVASSGILTPNWQHHNIPYTLKNTMEEEVERMV
ncbi:unnamed protein product [Cuscuta campestris]|uniref:Uncharacterized protein n=1 Tax=Cuscuta campestris TaxID=132261 RepID=A0A484M212_9ASTE|nr:unnamed protein product [Cuscuta campestris]